MALAKALWLIVAAAVCMVGCAPATFVVSVGEPKRELEMTIVERDTAMRGDRVAIIDVSGVIMNADRPELLRDGENPVGLLHEQLEKARADARVKAIILRLNTPGGTVTASDIMYREIKRFRERTGKPVICLMMDVAASGGYYVACSADRIVAYPTTITGSIGVIVQTISFEPALGRIGIEAEAITSGANKDAGSPLSRMTPEHRAVLQKLVDDCYARFVAKVREARPSIPAEHFDAMTDGRIVSGEEAARMGLVDEVGDLHTAFALAKSSAHISSADLVRYHRPLGYVGSPYESTHVPSPGTTQINLAQINVSGGGAPGFAGSPIGVYYLWRPMWP
jgi:protease-4